MAHIAERWGEAIQKACYISSVPQEFLAALIANESNGEEGASRFEPGVYSKLVKVRDGMRARYGSLIRGHLAGLQDAELRYLASSLGLTQVMGYHAAERGVKWEKLLESDFNLHFALLMLGQFAQQFGLDLRADFDPMFRCWNTGQPWDDPKTPRIEGKTFDPNYVANGLARMTIYREGAGREGSNI